MITNERQHRISNSQIKRFETAIANAEQAGPPTDTHPLIHTAMIDGLRSQLADLRQEVSDYEALRDGKVTTRVFHSLLEIPRALIEGRIAQRLTQKALGKKLGIPEQQIQRYERTSYSGVSIERLQEVADALEIRIAKTVEYHLPKTRPKRAPRSARRTPAAARTGRTEQLTTTITEGSRNMTAGRRTGKAAASAAGKTLSSKTASSAAKKAAASDLAQVGNRKVTGKSAASSAGKTLASKTASKTAKKAAASDLSQAAKKKR